MKDKPIWFNPNTGRCTLQQMSHLSKSFYPAGSGVWVWLCVLGPCFYATLVFVLAAWTIYSSLLPAIWKIDWNIRTNSVFLVLGQPGDVPPDKGHDRAGWSQCSCSGDTFAPVRCQGVGHSEQSRGRRSFRCTLYPSSLRSSWKTNTKCLYWEISK